MIVLHRIPQRPLKLRNPVAAIGIFDGVHRGHQAILAEAVARARRVRGTPVAVTFDPHPLVVLAPEKVPPMLLSLEQRLRGFQRCGIRVTLVIPFTRAFSRWSAREFVERILVRRLRVIDLVVGHDFGFGRGRSGTVETLETLGARFGFMVHPVGPVMQGGGRISSRRIRDQIRQGELAQAARGLSRPVTVVGRVVRGSGRGEELGFPTANLKMEYGVLPPVGVYAVWAKVGERLYKGMANIGLRPTFIKKVPGLRPGTFLEPLLEVHLFGCRRPLYGRRMTVAFLKFLRPERRFLSPEALVRQMGRDAHRARRLFPLQPRIVML